MSEDLLSIIDAITRRSQASKQADVKLGRSVHDDNKTHADINSLGRLLLQQAAYEQLQQHLLEHLEFWSHVDASVSHIHNRELVISCSNSASASRVRFMQNDILGQLDGFANKSAAGEISCALRQVNKIRVSVRHR